MMSDKQHLNQSLESIDQIDLAILKALSINGRTSYQEIANKLNVSRVTINERVKKLVNKGIISGFHTQINPNALGYTVAAYVGLITSQGKEAIKIIDGLRAIKEVEEIHIVTGRLDVLIKIRAKNHEHLQEILFEKVGSINGIDRSETMVILSSPKENTGLDLSQIQ